jgi:hypothetical protein
MSATAKSKAKQAAAPAAAAVAASVPAQAAKEKERLVQVIFRSADSAEAAAAETAAPPCASASQTAKFDQTKAADGLLVADGGAICLRVKEDNDGNMLNALLDRPTADADGGFAVTLQCVHTGDIGDNDVLLGWGQQNLGLTDSKACYGSGSFVFASSGRLVGLGEEGEALPGGKFQRNDTLSFVYRPGTIGAKAGTLHARRNGTAPQLIFSGLAHDLVPVVCFGGRSTSWRVVG